MCNTVCISLLSVDCPFQKHPLSAKYWCRIECSVAFAMRGVVSCSVTDDPIKECREQSGTIAAVLECTCSQRSTDSDKVSWFPIIYLCCLRHRTPADTHTPPINLYSEHTTPIYQQIILLSSTHSLNMLLFTECEMGNYHHIPISRHL